MALSGIAAEELEREFRQSEKQFADEQAAKARTYLYDAIFEYREISASTKLLTITNARDKHMAHSLTETRRERKAIIEPMKYGYETDVLNTSLRIVEKLHCWVNGKSLSFEESRKIDRGYAEALWSDCTFPISR